MFAYSSRRPIRRWSASAGARCGCERLEAPRRCWSRPGCATSAATPTGSTARSARITPRSAARSTRSAAGPTATPTPCRGCSPALDGAAQGPDRPLGAQISRTSPSPAPQIGFLQEMPALVGPVAEGDRHRHHGRADLSGLDAGERAAARAYERAARPLGGGGGVAEPAHTRAAGSRLNAGRLDAAARRGDGDRRCPPPHSTRPRRRRLVRLRRRRRMRPPTSAPTTAARSVFDGAPLHGAPGDPRRAGRRAGAVVRPSAGDDRARLNDVAPGWRLASGSPTACSTSPIATSHEHPDAARTRPALGVRVQLNDIAHTLSRRPSHPPRAFDQLLADRLAVARAGDVDRLRPAPAGSRCRCVRHGPRMPISNPFGEPESSPPSAAITALRPGRLAHRRNTISRPDTMTLHIDQGFRRRPFRRPRAEDRGIMERDLRDRRPRSALGPGRDAVGRRDRTRFMAGQNRDADGAFRDPGQLSSCRRFRRLRKRNSRLHPKLAARHPARRSVKLCGCASAPFALPLASDNALPTGAGIFGLPCTPC